MEVNDKRTKIENLFDQQKEILQKVNIENLFHSISELRTLELQKEIVKAIPVNKKATN